MFNDGFSIWPAGLPAVLIVEFVRKHTAGKPAS